MTGRMSNEEAVLNNKYLKSSVEIRTKMACFRKNNPNLNDFFEKNLNICIQTYMLYTEVKLMQIIQF